VEGGVLNESEGFAFAFGTWIDTERLEKGVRALSSCRWTFNPLITPSQVIHSRHADLVEKSHKKILPSMPSIGPQTHCKELSQNPHDRGKKSHSKTLP